MPRPEPSGFAIGRWLSLALTIAAIWFLLSGRLFAFSPAGLSSAREEAYLSPLKAGETAKARSLFDADIRANPADPTVYDTIAKSCLQVKRPELAREYLEKALMPCKDAPRPLRAQLYMDLSLCYQKLEKVKPQQQAILAAQRAYELDPASPDVLNDYGYLLADNGVDLDTAVQCTSNALRILKKQPNIPGMNKAAAVVEDSYGWALYQQGHYDAAVSALNQAVSDFHSEDEDQDDDTLSELYYHLGAAYRRDKRPEDARHALLLALQYNKDLKEAKDELEGLKSDPPLPVPASTPPDTSAKSVPMGSSQSDPANKASHASPGEASASPKPVRAVSQEAETSHKPDSASPERQP